MPLRALKACPLCWVAPNCGSYQRPPYWLELYKLTVETPSKTLVSLPFKSRDKPKPSGPLPSISEEIQRQIEADQKDIKKQLKHAQQQF